MHPRNFQCPRSTSHLLRRCSPASLIREALSPIDFPPPRALRACPVWAHLDPAPSVAAAPPPPPWAAGLGARRLPTAPRGRCIPSAGAAASALGAPGRQSSVRRGGVERPPGGSGLGRSQAAELPGRFGLGGARLLARCRALGVRGVW